MLEKAQRWHCWHLYLTHLRGTLHVGVSLWSRVGILCIEAVSVDKCGQGLGVNAIMDTVSGGTVFIVRISTCNGDFPDVQSANEVLPVIVAMTSCISLTFKTVLRGDAVWYLYPSTVFVVERTPCHC
jgi:hypothetical protein